MKFSKAAGLLPAALLLLAVAGCPQPDSPPQGPFELIIQTFPPTGTENSTNAKIELFDESGALLATGTVYSTPWVGIGSAADPLVLPRGIYYIKVSGANPVQTGPYGISARLVEGALSYYASALDDNSQDAGEPDDAVTAPNVPDNPLPLYPADAEGSRANRYIGSGDADWAVIVLP